jgi:DNA-binding transcriptional regulator YhcF (GntR family)
MIRIWLSRNTPVPIREQLSAQFILGIMSRRLPPGEKLPSVRELARRLKLHANTVSGCYQDLAKRGWVSRRRGSGVFVRPFRMPAEGDIETFVRAFLQEGAAHGYSIAELQDTLAKIAAHSCARQFLVVHPDPEMARVLAAEIEEATGSPVPFASAEDAPRHLTPSTCLLVSQVHFKAAPPWVGSAVLKEIRLRSLQDVLSERTRPAAAALIGIVSRSASIRQWAATLLSALGFPSDAVLLRDPGAEPWQEGLELCDIVGADVVAARELPRKIRPVVFRIVADDFLAEMRELAGVQAATISSSQS